jgi:hypothetical protein
LFGRARRVNDYGFHDDPLFYCGHAAASPREVR